jgi:hypothetical protein
VLTPVEFARLRAMLVHAENPQPSLFGTEGIVGANRLWSSETARFYLGNASASYQPGDIDPGRALIIGESESDSPIALDYRISPPRVVYFGDVDHTSYWLEVARSYDDFVSAFRENP